MELAYHRNNRLPKWQDDTPKVNEARMIPEERLEQILQRFQYLEAAMAEGVSGAEIADLAREYSEIKPVAEQITHRSGRC
jgi:hypothetical protein